MIFESSSPSISIDESVINEKQPANDDRNPECFPCDLFDWLSPTASVAAGIAFGITFGRSDTAGHEALMTGDMSLAVEQIIPRACWQS